MFVGKGQEQGIGLYPAQRRGRRLMACPLQHGVRKIRSQNCWRRLPCPTAQGKRHISSAATQVEDPGIRPGKDVSKGSSRPSPPEPVHVEGKDVVQQVVAGRNRSEHLAHGSGGGLWVRGA